MLYSHFSFLLETGLRATLYRKNQERINKLVHFLYVRKRDNFAFLIFGVCSQFCIMQIQKSFILIPVSEKFSGALVTKFPSRLIIGQHGYRPSLSSSALVFPQPTAVTHHSQATHPKMPRHAEKSATNGRVQQCETFGQGGYHRLQIHDCCMDQS